MKKPAEKTLYPVIARWLKRTHRCFATATNTGLRYSRPDVIGIRDVGGELSGEVETILVEVKRGTQPFATASGQTSGYKVYGNRVYLADLRTTPFTLEELHIASHLGIGLIQIRGTRCYEVLSSPYFEPITRLNLALLEKMRLGYCQICGSIVQLGNVGQSTFRMVSRSLLRAVENEKGYMFWNFQVGNRKHRLGMGKQSAIYDRRIICADCVKGVFSKLAFHKQIDIQ